MRTCSECGAEMYEGYCIASGEEYYCSDECLHKHYTPEEWEEMYEDGGDSYWTQWEEADDEEDYKTQQEENSRELNLSGFDDD